MLSSIRVREIKEADYLSVAALTAELGYSISQEHVHEQIKSILKHQDHFALVAVKNEEVIGYIHVFRTLRLTSTPFLEIGGIIVKQAERRQGIGKMLIDAIDKFSSENIKIRVRCNSKRELAHQFYHSLSFVEKKEQKVFEKDA